MAAQLTTTGASSEWNTWQELEDVFSSLGQLARAPLAPDEFYRSLLDECTRALSARAGVVWLRSADTFRALAHVRWSVAEAASDEGTRRAREKLLGEAAQRRDATTVSASSIGADQAGVRADEALLLGPVHAHSDDNRQTVAIGIIELAVAADMTPAARRASEQFLSAVCELAADYHAFAELRRLRHDDNDRTELLALSRYVHSQAGLVETAYAVANEGRRLIGCDRLSVLVAHGRRSRLLAVSGVSRIERRSGAVRRIEDLAELVRRANEPAFYADGQADTLPPLAAALERYAEDSHARQLAAVPVCEVRDSDHTDDKAAASRPAAPHQAPQFVLLAEQFHAGQEAWRRERLADVADVCATALYSAQQIDRLPLGQLLRRLGNWKHHVATHVSRAVVIFAAVAAGVAALVFVPADFTVECTGTLQPTVERSVFAPRGGVVDEVLVAHDTAVVAGQPLVRLRDPQLDLELKRVDGELETVARQLDAVRATRTNRQIREAKAVDSFRLSAEERELAQRQANLRLELELLMRERDALVVVSPIAGRVLNWEPGDRLAARPVERGEALLTVADLAADWQLELDVADDRIGFVLAAQHELRSDLPVQFRLSSDDRQQHRGHIAEIARLAEVNPQMPAAAPLVTVKVAIDALELNESARRELRPGVSARAQIACGRRPIGYVWLHDIWDAAVEWMKF